jgi:hypothetical protein
MTEDQNSIFMNNQSINMRKCFDSTRISFNHFPREFESQIKNNRSNSHSINSHNSHSPLVTSKSNLKKKQQQQQEQPPSPQSYQQQHRRKQLQLPIITHTCPTPVHNSPSTSTSRENSLKSSSQIRKRLLFFNVHNINKTNDYVSKYPQPRKFSLDSSHDRLKNNLRINNAAKQQNNCKHFPNPSPFTGFNKNKQSMDLPQILISNSSVTLSSIFNPNKINPKNNQNDELANKIDLSLLHTNRYMFNNRPLKRQMSAPKQLRADRKNNEEETHSASTNSLQLSSNNINNNIINGSGRRRFRSMKIADMSSSSSPTSPLTSLAVTSNYRLNRSHSERAAKNNEQTDSFIENNTNSKALSVSCDNNINDSSSKVEREEFVVKSNKNNKQIILQKSDLYKVDIIGDNSNMNNSKIDHDETESLLQEKSSRKKKKMSNKSDTLDSNSKYEVESIVSFFVHFFSSSDRNLRFF